ncbi:glycoside hydrolase family 10 protein [Flagellimonas myxillae]|uniref:glycoside hydrolase family 10 protein n=1 Tax=Flagellimonas myxillae TaxID=2942214 RepID=UPI00201F5B4E|nr:family 10 glycosylhydrolase [Muricauda myxillae]MCL6265403.1 family 10 glycosylhydrolase [Muricauda myxillae]
MRTIAFLIFPLLFISCSVFRAPSITPKTEFRGIWIATVANIDWPKNANDLTDKKKADFIRILDFYQNLNFNAAIVQIRTAGDALYPSQRSPWSKYLTGKQGEPPSDFESPLQWMIQETHKRGMEFHAWLNPYRATVDLDTLSLSKQHDFYQHPEWMVKYGKKYYYNPGLPEVRKKFDSIIAELVQNYEIDAIHFDDYFYPYKIKDEVFNDSLTFEQFGLPDQTLGDWRRSNVDSLVKNVHQTIKRHKPWVQFGISPFGVWKNKGTDPKGSDTKAGQTTFEDLYADPLLWTEQGWLDYLAPQVYWSMDYAPASHRIITEWWETNAKGGNLYIGNGTYKIKNNADKAWNRRNEIPKQLRLARGLGKIDGNIFFSAKSLMGQHERVTNTLKRKFYRFPAHNPVGLVVSKREIALPGIASYRKHNKTLELCVSHSDTVPRFLNLYRSKSNFKSGDAVMVEKKYLPEGEQDMCLEINSLRVPAGITISDAFGNESEVLVVETQGNN